MHPFRDRRFRALVVGQAVNGIGSWCALIAIWGYAGERFHATPWQISVLGLTWTVPGALLGPFAGVPTDRLDPRRVLMAADLASAACAVAMAFSDSYWMLVIWSCAQGFSKSFAAPAFSALAPRIVEDGQLLTANALLSSATQLSIAFGPLLGATAIELSGARGAFLVDAVTYMVGVMVVFPLVLRPRAPREASSPWEDAREGWRVVRSRPDVRRLFLGVAGVYVLWGSGVTIEPLYVRLVLHRSPAVFALLQTVFGITLVLSGLAVARVGERAARERVVAVACIGSGLGAIGYLGTSYIGVAIACIAFWGVATQWVTAPMRTLLQRAVPVEVHGRVFALDETLRNWSMAIATGTAGLVYSATGSLGAGIFYGAFPILGGVLLLRAHRSRTRPPLDAGPVTPGFRATTRG